MKTRLLAIIFCAALVTVGSFLAGPGEWPWQTGWPVASAHDHISGDWAGAFKVMTFTEPCTLSLKLKDGVVTGTIDSHHTGSGKIVDGKWADGKLTFTAQFEKHDSISLTGSLVDGKLTGEFTTEGHTGTWEVSRK